MEDDWGCQRGSVFAIPKLTKNTNDFYGILINDVDVEDRVGIAITEKPSVKYYVVFCAISMVVCGCLPNASLRISLQPLNSLGEFRWEMFVGCYPR